MIESGADVVLVDGKVEGLSLAKRVYSATKGADIKLGIDAVGGLASHRIAETLCDGATLVNYGAMSGEPCSIAPTTIIFKDVTIRGFWLAKWFRNSSSEQQKELYGNIINMIAKGQLSAPIDSTFLVKDIKAAVKLAAAGERQGKVILVSENLKL